MIDYSKLRNWDEVLPEVLAELREARRLREVFGPEKPIIDPRYLPSEEDRQFGEDEELTNHLNKMGYS